MWFIRIILLLVLVCVPAVSCWADEAPAGQTGDGSVAAPKPADPSAAGSSADKQAPAASHDDDTRTSMCLMIESAARANSLPLDFFARVIWQESRFQPDAVGPLTRSGDRAQGIAQFMPRTAGERQLLDPFDPVQALPKAAEFLAELRDQFGNLGLAAAAYNAGPRRVREWIEGTGSMPAETRAYVAAITGSSVEQWRDAGHQAPASSRPTPDCHDLMALLKQAPNPFIAGLEQHVKIGAASPWGVQLAAGFSRDNAMAMYSRAIKRLGPVIGSRDPEILGSVLRTRGTHMFYQVRIGAESRTAADTLCGQIRRAGQACLVLRNG